MYLFKSLLALLLLIAISDAFLWYGNNDDDDNDFGCFNTFDDNDDDDDDNDGFDICLATLIGGGIVIIGLYPLLAGVQRNRISHQQAYYQRRQDAVTPVNFENPYETRPKPIGNRISNYFTKVAKFWTHQLQRNGFLERKQQFPYQQPYYEPVQPVEEQQPVQPVAST